MWEGFMNCQHLSEHSMQAFAPLGIDDAMQAASGGSLGRVLRESDMRSRSSKSLLRLGPLGPLMWVRGDGDGMWPSATATAVQGFELGQLRRPHR